jgi:hypothetical protein
VQKRLVALFIILGLVTAYSLLSLVDTDDDQREVNRDYSRLSPNDEVGVAKPLRTEVSKHALTSNNQAAKGLANDNRKMIPGNIKLLGISYGEAGSTDVDAESYALIQYNSDLYEHYVFDLIGNSSIRLVTIDMNTVDLNYNDEIYTIELTPPNLLSKTYRENEKTYSEFLEMTPDEIGTRPRIIEHLITLTPTPYIADGNLIGPGLNPALFEQAGLKSDDVLKTINGKSITIESEFKAIKEELKTASTLEFVVMRRGRLLTLYLDIPSETLEVTMD